MAFASGVSAAFDCSFETANQQWANVSGTKGFVLVPDFVLPFSGDEPSFEVTNSVFDVRGCDSAMERRTRTAIVPERNNSHPTAQETQMFRDFSTLVIEKRRDPHCGEIALKTQVVLDACWQSAREGRSVRVG